MNLYLENYGVYAELISNKAMIIDVDSINFSNYEYHYNWILNIMKDTIETEYTRTVFITLQFGQAGPTCQLSIQDYWLNLIMWYHIIRAGGRIRPKHIFFDPAITRGTIKEYIDKFFIEVYMKNIDIVDMNNIIDDALYRMIHVDKFSWYLANTINLEDFIDLMNANPRFNEILHSDLSRVSVEEVKSEGMRLTEESINIIMNSDHSLANFFRAQEGINTKQYKEFGINIGTKPDGRGGIFPSIVNRSFIMGGVNDLMSYYIESNNGRTAQIIVDKNVGGSGAFARLLGLNSSDSYLHHNKDYCCDSKNFIHLLITDKDILRRYENRYYRLTENGLDYKIHANDDFLIGKVILLRSPMTCASAARGEGICYRCYGDLAYINKDISIGKLAAELLSSVLTQKMLSAKHLLEAAVIALTWNPEFNDFFEVEFNIIKTRQDIDYSGIKLYINKSNINNDDDENEDDYYVEYIDDYSLINKNKKIDFSATDNKGNGIKLFITPELAAFIKETVPASQLEDDEIYLDMNVLKQEDMPLFTTQIFNNDLNAILEKIKSTIDNKKITTSFDKDGLLAELLSNLKEGKLGLAGVHAEVILSNQIRSTDDILEAPDWTIPNVPYTINTLKTALKNNPSISVSMAFQGIKKALYDPLTFRKHKASVFDLFYMAKPQEFLHDQEAIDHKEPDVDENGLKIVMKKVEDENIK